MQPQLIPVIKSYHTTIMEKEWQAITQKELTPVKSFKQTGDTITIYSLTGR